jgi:chloramphenicol 3-O phosphotransferase
MIILLNGCTSAGKTSLAMALQACLPGARLRYGIDDGFAMLPLRYHNNAEGFFFTTDAEGFVRLNFGAVGASTLAAYHRAAVAIAVHTDLIVDDVVLTPALREHWLTLLPDETLLVGVHCPLATLERREIARGDRMIGQARGQFGHVHAAMVYDVEVDTGGMAIEACADLIAAAVARGGAGAALRRMRGQGAA